MSSATDTILIVDDEEEARTWFARFLGEEYDVRTASDGETAIEQVDDTVDVVLLDRRMPGLSGEEVLEQIRDRGYACRVAMVTAVDPDVDIVEMGFDDYIQKPVEKEELVDLVESLLVRPATADPLDEPLALAAKKAALESTHDPAALEANDEYQRLRTRLEEARQEIQQTLGRATASDGTTPERVHETCSECDNTTFALVPVDDYFEVVCSECGTPFGRGFTHLPGE